MTTSLSDISPILKTLYPEGVPLNLVYKDHPLYAMITKDESFYGENMKLPLIYGNPQGRSATFANAQSNVSPSKTSAFFLTRVSDYAIARLKNEAIEASQNNAGAFIESLKLEVDGATLQAGASDAQALWGDGSGIVGTIGLIATNTITLADIEQIVNFEVGQTLSVFTIGAPAVETGSLVISGVNRDSGVLTFTGNVTAGVATAVNGMGLCVQGDYLAKLSGVFGWIPSVLAGGDNFFGVNRNADKVRLAGHYKDLSALPIEEAVIEAAKQIARDGGKPDHDFMNYAEFSQFEKALGSKVQYVDTKGPAELSFRGILINGPKGMIQVLADQNCPSGKMLMTQLDTWKLASLKQAVRILDLDGNKMLRISNDDAVEIRIGGYKQLGNKAPGYNGVFKI